MNSELDKVKEAILRKTKTISYLAGQEALTATLSPLWEQSARYPGVWRRIVESHGYANYTILQVYYEAGARVSEAITHHELFYLVLQGLLEIRGQQVELLGTYTVEQHTPLNVQALEDSHALVIVTPALSQYLT